MKPPGRLLRGLLRAPAGLYRIGVGRLLGHRFLLLRHRGRRTGREYLTVLEVVEWRPRWREAIVLAGLGKRAQWYRNLRAGGAIEVQIAAERYVPEPRWLDADEATTVLAGYERRNRLAAPVLRRVLSRLAGFDYDGSPGARRRLAHELPMVGLQRPAD